MNRGQEIFKYGAPLRGPEVLYYTNHALSYDQSKKIPSWVAEHLTADNMKENKTKRLLLRLKPSTMKKAQRKAIEDDRSLNQTIELAIEEYIKQKP